jgi:5'-nucleotidase/UDP-sugar diphosphatase
VARRATAIKDVRSSSEVALLLLDAGNTLFGQWLAQRSDGRAIVQAMNALDYDAMAVGATDLDKGLQVLMERAKEARFAILSCNIARTEDGETVLAPYTVVDRNGVRLGILGVTEPEAIGVLEVADAATVADPVESVRKFVPEVRAKSDIVILLSHLGLEADQALAKAVPGINIIVGGKSRQTLQAPEVVGATVIVQAGYDGKWLGRLDVTFDAQQEPVDPKVEIISLGPEVADDPELAKLVASYRELFPQPTPVPSPT